MRSIFAFSALAAFTAGPSLFLPPFLRPLNTASSKTFDMSETCRRLRRKNKLRALGIGGARI